MFERVLVASTFFVVASLAAEARPVRTAHAAECNVIMPCDFSSSPDHQIAQRRLPLMQRTSVSVASIGVGGERVIGSRPAGCPQSFCGCGASIRVFGHIVPELNLASAWLRFPRTSPSPGMVAARQGHVFVLEQHIGGDTWMAYDANSGGHVTRLHPRSLSGYTVVNPHAA